MISRDHSLTKEFPSQEKPPKRRWGITTKAANDMVDFMWNQGKLVRASDVRVAVENYTSAIYLVNELYENSLKRAYGELNHAGIINYAQVVAVHFNQEGIGCDTAYPN
ncbi:hypothetical protein FSST1_011784 [Fusarium sambucinum]